MDAQRRLILLALLAGCAPVEADRPALVPEPSSIRFDGEGWPGIDDAAVIGGPAVAPEVLGLPVGEGRPLGNVAFVDVEGLAAGAYRLTVDRGVVIESSDEAGAQAGLQTLRQLLPADGGLIGAVLPRVVIEDAPRFGWRGSMIDVARHFFGLDDLKAHVDAMARHKLNRLHVHLTDDQGWRIEVPGYPALTAVGGASEVGGGEGGFLTLAQWRELDAYAGARGIVLIPEIDMPGHVGAALASIPELNPDGVAIEPYTGTEVGWSSLCLQCPATMPFVEAVLEAVAENTTGPWIHVGGDEADETAPEDYRAFLQDVQGIVAGLGKELVGWEEIAGAELAPPFLAQHWLQEGLAEQAQAQGAGIISSPADRAYLDMMVDLTNPVGTLWAGLTDLEDAYTWDPQLGFEDEVVGIEAPLWAETTETWDDVEFLVWPRLAGHAELGWSQGPRDWDGYVERLRVHAARLDALGLNWYPSPEIEWDL